MKVQFRHGSEFPGVEWTMRVDNWNGVPRTYDLYPAKPDAGGVRVLSVVRSADRRKFATGQTSSGRLVAWPLPAEGISDDELDAWAANPDNRGDFNSVPHLRPLTPEQRSKALSEARIRMNTSPGWIYSGAVRQAAEDILKGDTPMAELNVALMAHDPTGTKAARAAADGLTWDQFRDRAV